MELGIVGLGRMGTNIALRVMQSGHTCVVNDVSTAAVARLEAEGATGAPTIADLVSRMTPPRAVWVMVPAGHITEGVVSELGATLAPGDTIVDGGNSFYRDDLRRAAELDARGIRYVDCGTSGGVYGAKRGFCLMVGGSDEAFRALEPIFSALAPGIEMAERTPGRTGDPAPEEQGYLHCGPPGAGHFVKMVHNGIEYGLMAAFAEGFNILKNADAGLKAREADAETAPFPHPEYYEYTLDIPAIAELWRRGSVVSSWLLDLTATAFQESDELEEYTGHVSDSGEGRWTAMAAIEESVPADVLTTALYSRFTSRGEADFANRVLSAMRKQFGGHAEKHS